MDFNLTKLAAELSFDWQGAVILLMFAYAAWRLVRNIYYQFTAPSKAGCAKGCATCVASPQPE